MAITRYSPPSFHLLFIFSLLFSAVSHPSFFVPFLFSSFFPFLQVHFVTFSLYDGPPKVQTPPLLYNVNVDPSENFPLNSTNFSSYDDIVSDFQVLSYIFPSPTLSSIYLSRLLTLSLSLFFSSHKIYRLQPRSILKRWYWQWIKQGMHTPLTSPILSPL